MDMKFKVFCLNFWKKVCVIKHKKREIEMAFSFTGFSKLLSEFFLLFVSPIFVFDKIGLNYFSFLIFSLLFLPLRF